MGHPQSIVIRIKKLSHFRGEIPQYKTEGASGFDVRACIDKTITIKPQERVLIPTGLSFEIPMGFEIQARPRSGLALKHGLTLLNTPGTIDADYRGEVQIIIINNGVESVQIQDQERIAQLVLCPVFQASFKLVDVLGETKRGGGGFGSTGK